MSYALSKYYAVFIMKNKFNQLKTLHGIKRNTSVNNPNFNFFPVMHNAIRAGNYFHLL